MRSQTTLPAGVETVRPSNPTDQSRLRGWQLDALSLWAIALGVAITLLPALIRPDLMLVGHDVVLPYNTEINTRWALGLGQIPLWNPYVLSGFPALADFQSGVLYLPNALLRMLPPSAFFTWSVALHLWLGGAGMYFLCRDLGTSRPAATMAAMTVALGGAVTPRMLAGMLHFISGIAWVPWALYLARRALPERRLRPHVGLVVVLALQYFAGYAQIFVYTVAAVAFRFGWWAVRERTCQRPMTVQLGRAVLALTLTLGLVAGLIAVQAIAGAQLLQEMGRTAGITFDAATRWSLEPRDLLAFLYPRAFAIPGKPFHEDSGAILWEKSGYLGLVIPLLAIVGATRLRRHHDIQFFVCLAVVTFLLALGGYVPLFQLHHLLFGGFRYPGRLLPIFAVATAAIAAVGLDTLLNWCREPDSRRRAWLVAAAVTVTAIAPAALVALWHPESIEIPASSVLGTPWWVPALTGSAMLSLPLLGRRGSLAFLGAGAFVVLVVSADLVSFAGRFVIPGDPPHQTRIAAALAADGVGRVVSACEEGYSNLRPMDPLVPMVDGLNPAYFKSYAQFTQLVSEGRVTGAYRQAPTVWTDVPARLDLLPLLNVTHMVKCTPYTGDRFSLVDRVDGLYLYRFLGAAPRAYWACDVDVVDSGKEAIDRLSDRRRDARRRAVVQQSPEQGSAGGVGSCQPDATVDVLTRDTPAGALVVDVGSRSDGLLVMSEPYFGGRRARVDGKDVPVLRANLAFSAVQVPHGEHRVELGYDPTLFILGGAISLVTLLGLFALALGREKSMARLAMPRNAPEPALA